MKLLLKLKSILDEWLSEQRNSGGMLFVILMSVSAMLPVEEPYKYNETIHRTAQFQNLTGDQNSVNVYNINGNVTVKEHSGNDVKVTAEKLIRSDRQSDLERGIEEMKLVVDQQGELILIYLDAPFIRLEKRDRGISYNLKSDRKDTGYDFRFHFKVQVPRNTNVYASTINGDVNVIQIDSRNIIAKNVNGNIDLRQISGQTEATTVNGNIRASYNKNPESDSNYKTVNGSIEVSYPAGLSADLSFSSLHGDLYTDFENIQQIRPHVEQSFSKSETRYRINRSSPYRIGEGGPELSFNVLNGNVYLKKLEN